MDIALHDARARVAWKILVRQAKKNDPKISYAELAKLTGVHHRQHANFLELIQIYCHENEIPHLTALVVGDKSGLPGVGCDINLEDIPKEYRRIRDFPWPEAPNSFVTVAYLSRRKSTRNLIGASSNSRPTVIYWWVNHGLTYNYEMKGGFLWSPKTSKDGSRNRYYENMAELRPGDQVFSYTNGFIRSYGVVTTLPSTSPRPDLGVAGEKWAESGWLVDIAFEDLPRPFQPKAVFDEIKSLMPQKYLPLDRKGDGQGSLTKISEDLANYIRSKGEVDQALLITSMPNRDHDEEDRLENEIKQRTNIEPLEKEQLIKSRRGQGVFKSNVKLYEDHCRVTGLKDRNHLRASHIKPWAKSSDAEKIDGFNGLLLSPHVDYLFDSGFISFSDGRDLLISENLSVDVLHLWGVPIQLNVGSFHPDQLKYFAYHRAEIFQG